MLKIIVALTTIHLFESIKASKLESFEEDADGLMKTILGGVDKINHTYPIRNITQNETNIAPDNEEKSELKFSNLTKEEYEIKRILELVHDNTSTIIPDFGNDVDEIELLTRRFDEERKGKNPRSKRLLERTHRNLYLVQQFVYETRNRLPYAQVLRKKYKNQLRYKIGYLMALVRNLKRLQMVLYNSYKSIGFKINNYIYHILVFEKVLRLDVDIKDVIKFIKKLNKQREQEEESKEEDNTDNGFGNFSFPIGGMGAKIPNGTALFPHALSGIPGGPRPGFPGPGGPMDKKVYNLHSMKNQWRRMNSGTRKPRNEVRKIIKPYVSSKRSRNKSQLWSPSKRMKKSYLDYKSLYT